jgi:hypothetical protein
MPGSLTSRDRSTCGAAPQPKFRLRHREITRPAPLTLKLVEATALPLPRDADPLHPALRRHASPLEEAGFELSVPRDTTTIPSGAKVRSGRAYEGARPLLHGLDRCTCWSLAGSGTLDLGTGLYSLLALLPALAGMIAGQHLLDVMRPETFRRWFFSGLVLLGGELAIRGLL